MPTTQQQQSQIDRLRLLAQTLGWEVVKIDTTGPEIVVELRKAKEG